MIADRQVVVDNADNSLTENLTQRSKRYLSARWARNTCFALIAIMNLSAWIDLQGIFVELPIMVLLTPEGWALPSLINLSISIANIVPLLLVLLRWHQGSRFSEIPYIYIIILVGAISCGGLALFWQKTIFFFGSQRSIWLLTAIFSLSILDCTSSLVFFDYMKRFQSKYLTAVFLGEGLTAAIPTLLALAQGSMGDPICIENINSTGVQPVYPQPRFSVTVFLLLMTFIIIASLFAFMLLRWTKIISMAGAAEKETPTKVVEDPVLVGNHDLTMDPFFQPSKTSRCFHGKMTCKSLIFLLLVNTLNSSVLFGCMPSLSTYALLPYGQKTFYYACILGPIAYPLVLLGSTRWQIVSNMTTILGSVLGIILFFFIGMAAWQSPCPWWADTIHGSIFMVSIWFLTTLVIAFVRITIGNRIKIGWNGDEGLFYFGASLQLGFLLGTTPVYLLINNFGMFIDRQPCQKYCIE